MVHKMQRLALSSTSMEVDTPPACPPITEEAEAQEHEEEKEKEEKAVVHSGQATTTHQSPPTPWPTLHHSPQ